MSTATAERVSVEASDNYVFQRSLLAYHTAAQLINGVVLEVGTGSGYGVDVVSPRADRFITIDKFDCGLDLRQSPNVEFRRMTVPPLAGVADQSVDCVISFQVIEHIEDDVKMIEEVWRVLRPGGRFIVSTPNRLMSLTRNPWHVREYTPAEFAALLGTKCDKVEQMGVFGNAKVMEYYTANRASVQRIARLDVLDLQHRLPRWMLQIPYDLLNRLNRRRLLSENNDLTRSIRMEDYRLVPAHEGCFDWFFVATKKPL